jgi:eukaryotic-like serine/threonine-protein kinase
MESAVPGRLIAGRYRLATVVGRGGMGVVWHARDELLSRDVAVKELARPAYMSADEQQAACRRAVREARAAARLSHHNVVQIFDILEADDGSWIVMELLSAQSLRDLLAQDGPLAPVQAAQIGLEILTALQAAHALGIVHRDVKPANILMARDRAVLVDFGIAQVAETSSGATTASMLIGSPAYMAPERARGGPSGPPADLWGLGASLYAAVEGRGPFERDGSALASLTAVVADEPEPVTRAGPLLWPVISGLLRKDPGERLGAVEAERMLRLAVAPAAPAPAVISGHRRRRRSQRAAGWLAGVALLVMASATAVVLDRPVQAGHQTVAPAMPPAPASSAAARPSARPSAQPTGAPRARAGTGRPVVASPATPAGPGVKAQAAKPGNGNGKAKGQRKGSKSAG